MPGVCCITECKHVSKKDAKCSLKTFPRRFDVLDTWISKIKQVNGSSWERKMHHRICTCHFDSDQYFIKNNNKKKFKKNAVPRLFGNCIEHYTGELLATSSSSAHHFSRSLLPAIKPVFLAPRVPLTTTNIAPSPQTLGYLIPIQTLSGRLPLSNNSGGPRRQISVPLNIISTPTTTLIQPNKPMNRTVLAKQTTLVSANSLEVPPQQSQSVKKVENPAFIVKTSEDPLVPKIFKGLQKMLSNLKPPSPAREESVLPDIVDEDTLEEFDGDKISLSLNSSPATYLNAPNKNKTVKTRSSSRQNSSAKNKPSTNQNKQLKTMVSTKQNVPPTTSVLSNSLEVPPQQSLSDMKVDNSEVSVETSEDPLMPKLFENLEKMFSNLKPLDPVKEEDFLPVNVNEETLEEFDGDIIEKNLSCVRELCRVCANPKAQDEDEMVQILSKEGERLRLSEKMLQLLPIAFSAKEDRLPMQVCHSCIKSLDICHDLIISCSLADAKLHQLIMQEDQRVGSPINCVENMSETLLKKDGHLDGDDSMDCSPLSPPCSLPPPCSPLSIGQQLPTIRSCTYPECEFECSDYKQMRKHIKLSHDVILCTQCDVWYEKAADLLNHMKQSHSKSILCDTCGAVVNSRTISKHMLTHRPQDLPCSYCDKKFTHKALLKRHEQTHTNRKIKCALCSRIFKTKRYLVVHLKMVHIKDWIYKCKKCNLDTTCSKEIESHVLTHKIERQHDDDLLFTRYSKHKCLLCGESFSNIFYLQRHKWKKRCKEVRHKFCLNRLMKCPDCGEFFKGPSALGRHAKDLHNKTRDMAKGAKKGSFNCIYCGKNCKSYYLLRQHIRSHTNEQPYKCKLCDKKYANRISLRHHEVKEHLFEEPTFQCTECSRSYSTIGLLNKHKRSHTKPEKCHFCNKGFALRGQLQRHEQIHTGYKPYKCPICKKGFTQKQEMEFHHLVHLNDKKFKCSNCNFKSNKLHDVVTHINMDHSPSEEVQVLKRDLNDTAEWGDPERSEEIEMNDGVVAKVTQMPDGIIEVTLPLGMMSLDFLSQ